MPRTRKSRRKSVGRASSGRTPEERGHRTAQTHAIRFGTDGWRGQIALDFNRDNVTLVARAITRYLVEFEDVRSGVLVAYDTRFGADRFARRVAEVLSGAGIRIGLADAPTPTPALSFAVRAQGAAGGVMLTASHNPAEWLGIKLKSPFGGSASPRAVAELEKFLAAEDSLPADTPQPNLIAPFDFQAPYLNRLRELVSLERIAEARIGGAPLRFVVDPMHGAGAGYLKECFESTGTGCTEIRGNRDPLFGGGQPEPMPQHLVPLMDAVRDDQAAAGFATDGDADRIGAVDEQGNYVDPHKIFALILRHLVERNELRGEVARTVSSSSMIDHMCEKYGLALHEVPIGFKHIAELMLERNLLIGGEESGGIGIRPHLPERDGLLNSLLLAEIVATEGKPLSACVEELQLQFGPLHYCRLDLELPDRQKRRVMSYFRRKLLDRIGKWRVRGRNDLDGHKFFFGDGRWVLARASGTEPLIRIYAEAETPELAGQIAGKTAEIARTI